MAMGVKRMTRTATCTCGHPARYHHQFGSQPCGEGSCDCRRYIDRAPSPVAPLSQWSTNLWGEVQKLPTHTEEER